MKFIQKEKYISLLIFLLISVSNIAFANNEIIFTRNLLPNTTSTWHGTLTQDNLPARKSQNNNIANGGQETVDFSVTTNGSGVPTAIDLTFTGHSATLSVDNQLTCFSAPLDTKSVSVNPLFIFPSGDGYAASFSNGDLNGPEFFNGVNGLAIIEGDGFDPNTGNPVDLEDNEAQGSVNFQYVFTTEVGQACGEGGQTMGGTCSLPCSFLWQAQCVDNCSGVGKVRIDQASYNIDETAGTIAVQVLRTQGITGEIMVDFSTSSAGVATPATSGVDYTSTSGTLTWADQDSSAKTVNIPILADMVVEGQEMFKLILSNPQGGAELGSIPETIITIDDRPDLTIQNFTVDINTLEQSGNTYTLPDVEFTVKNIATAGQQATGIIVNVSDGASFNQDYNVMDLATGQSEVITFDYDVTSAIQAGMGESNGNILTVTVDPSNAIPEKLEGNNQTTNSVVVDVRPVVTKITPQYTLDNAFFISAVTVTNDVVTEVDWNGPILSGTGSAPFGIVSYNLNGNDVDVSGTATGATYPYDMGTEFDNLNSCNANLLIVEAEINGFISEALTNNTTVFVVPDWVLWIISNISGSAVEFTTMLAAPVVKYIYDFAYPDPEFEAILTVPNGVPYFGGEEFGIMPSQASINTEVASSGAGSAKLAGMTGVKVATFQILGELFGEGQVRFDCTKGLELLSTTFGIQVEGRVTREQPLLEIFPAVIAAQSLPLVGDLIKWVTDSAIISGSIGPKVNVTAKFVPDQSGELKFDSGTGRGAVPIQATLTLSPFENVEISLSGGGEPFVSLKFPAPYLDKVGIKLKLTAALDVYGYGTEYVSAVNCTLPGGCSIADSFRNVFMSPTLKLLPRLHIETENYAQFIQSKNKKQSFNKSKAINSSDEESLLVSNTFPKANTNIASKSDGKRMIVYVHDDPSDATGHANEIRSILYDGNNWQAPVDVVDDEMSDFSPTINYDITGNAIVVWEKSTLPSNQTPSDFDLTFAQSLEIYSSFYNGTNWSAATQLTNNSLMDHSVKLIKANDGSLMTMWRSHSGNNLIGDALNPVSINYSTWNGSTWSAAANIMTGQTEILQTALGLNSSNQGVMIFVKSVGGLDVSNNELYYITYNGSWTTPTLMTNDSVNDSAPQVVYDNSGSRHIVWIRDGEIVWLKDSFNVTQAQVIKTASDDAGFMDMRLIANDSGNLAIVWQSAMGEGSNIAYLIYDKTANNWSQVQLLQSDPDAESGLDVVFANDGSIQLSYAKTQMNFIDQQVTTPETGTYMVDKLPVLGQTDLAFFKHDVGLDLTVTQLDIAPGNIFPGEDYDLKVTFKNSGDLQINSAVLHVFRNAQQIDTVTITNIKAGEQREIIVNGNLGPNTQQEFKAIIDATGIVAEKDENNNELLLRLNSAGFDFIFDDGFE